MLPIVDFSVAVVVGVAGITAVALAVAATEELTTVADADGIAWGGC